MDRRLFSIALGLLMLAAWPLAAQNGPDALSAFAERMMKGGRVEFHFTAVDPEGNVQYDGTGDVLLFGDRYRMETGQMLVVCSGGVKWFYNKETDEIVIQPVNEDNTNIMDNPFAILKDAGRNYNVVFGRQDAGGIPQHIELESKAGAKYTIAILRYEKRESPDGSLFAFDVDRYPDAVITDLR